MISDDVLSGVVAFFLFVRSQSAVKALVYIRYLEMPSAENPINPTGASPAETPPPQTPPAEPPPTVNAPVKSGNGEPAEDPKWLATRLSRAAEKAVADLLEGVGAQSLDDLKAWQKAVAEAEQLKMTAEQKAEADRQALIKERDTAARKADKALQEQAELSTSLNAMKSTIVNDRIAAKLEVAALKALSEYPEDVVTLIRKDFPTEFLAAADEEGNIKKDAIDALIAKAKEVRPTWFAKGGGPTAPGSPSNFGGHAVPPPEKGREKASRLNQRIIRG